MDAPPPAPHTPSAFLAAVEDRIAAALRVGEGTDAARRTPLLDRAAAWLVDAPGAKRARPLLTRLFGGALRLPWAASVDIAASAELIHTASLLHDDVVDRAATRRARPTANALWGDGVAVLAGDLVLAAALRSLSGLPRELTAGAVETVVAMARSALLEVAHRGRLPEELPIWAEIATGKTAALFVWCGQAVGFAAGDPEAGRRFGAFGHHLGLAFQLADDLKDFSARDHGKESLADLRNGNPSYPIWLAARGSTEARGLVEALWRGGDAATHEALAAAASAVAASGALEATADRVREHLDEGLLALGPWRRHPALATLGAWVADLEAGLPGGRGTAPRSAAPLAPGRPPAGAARWRLPDDACEMESRKEASCS